MRYPIDVTFRRNTSGVLLIEALVSFGLMLVVALTALGLQAHARKARVKARSVIAATSIARSVMERCRAQGYDALSYGETKSTEVVSLQREGMESKQTFQVIRSVNTAPIDGLKSVVVTVRWESGKVDLEGYFAK